MLHCKIDIKPYKVLFYGLTETAARRHIKTPMMMIHTSTTELAGMLMFIASPEKPVYAVMIPASETATPAITASQPNHLG